MPAFRLSIPAAHLTRRLKERLRGDPPNTSQRVVWHRDAESVLVYADSLNARMLDGWLLCNLNLETTQTGVQTLQFVYFLGKDGEGAGIQASCTINAPTTDRKSTRLNSSHSQISYAVFCLKKKINEVLYETIGDATTTLGMVTTSLPATNF